MILVLLGTQKHRFDRLIDYTIKLAKEEKITDKIIIQTGENTYNYDDFKDYNTNISIEFKGYLDNYEQLLQRAQVIFCHSGVGIIMDGLKYNKKIITVPRQAKLDEHIDNHQEEIAYELDNKNYLFLAKDYEQFKNKYKLLESHNFKPYKSNNEKFNLKLNQLIDDIIGE